MLTHAWTEHLPGAMWIMPGSHWAYELDFGSEEWMPEALRAAGIDPAILQPRTYAAAIEFEQRESSPATTLVAQLLERLAGSDFNAAFPGYPAVCTIHHHTQLWWRTNDAALRDRLARVSA
jgi:hypothetical protein